MSTLTADPGFARGHVLGVTKTYYDAQPGDGSNLLGVRKVFTDSDPQSGQILSNETVECVVVRNTSGGALLPKTLVRFSASAVLTSVDAGAKDSDVRIGVVDEYLPAAGVPVNEVFWLVVKGPTVVTTNGNPIAAGAAVSATPSTAGKVIAGTVKNVGTAISAATGTEVRVLANTLA
jgi:hypothetical protein